MQWTITSFPPCTHHIFLSHTAEDRENLVWPVYNRLYRKGIFPWLDRHDYPSGRTSSQALRDSLLHCRHVVFFITESMLKQSRGWCVQELTWSDLIQDNLIVPGRRLLNVIFPIYFVDQRNRRLPRSVWQRFRDQGVFFSGGDPVRFAVRQITDFLKREEDLSREHDLVFLESNPLNDAISRTPGLLDRVSQFLPESLLSD